MPSGRPAGPVFANTRSDRVAAVRRLAGRPRAVAGGDRVVAEGVQSAREAADAGAVLDLWLTPQIGERHREVPRAVAASGGYVHWATPEVVAAMSPSSQGVLAVARWPVPEFADVLGALPPGAVVGVFDEIRDPGNAGAAIRAADAAGLDAVVFTAGSVDARATKVIRASAGSFFHVPVVQHVPVAEALTRLKSAGLLILAADAAGSVSLDDLPSPVAGRGTAWVLGTEARGMATDVREAADGIVRIPMYGRTESLNLAMAATLCFYASARIRAASR